MAENKSKYTDEWVSRLIELSTEGVFCYERYLLDKSDWKELALKMKALQTHIEKYMGGSKSNKKLFE
jgi:hypothetical protein